MGIVGRIIGPLFAVVWFVFFKSIFATIKKTIVKQQKVSK